MKLACTASNPPNSQQTSHPISSKQASLHSTAVKGPCVQRMSGQVPRLPLLRSQALQAGGLPLLNPNPDHLSSRHSWPDQIRAIEFQKWTESGEGEVECVGGHSWLSKGESVRCNSWTPSTHVHNPITTFMSFLWFPASKEYLRYTLQSHF